MMDIFSIKELQRKSHIATRRKNSRIVDRRESYAEQENLGACAGPKKQIEIEVLTYLYLTYFTYNVSLQKHAILYSQKQAK